MNLSALKDAFLPNRAIDRSVSLALIALWAGLALLVWTLSPWETLPGPGEVWTALTSLWWDHGMGPELFTTLGLIAHALFLTIVISLVLSYATVATGGGYNLKVALLTFGMSTFFVTAMASEVMSIPRERFEYMRVLGASEGRILLEVVILGTLDKALDVLRQNLAIGWAMTRTRRSTWRRSTRSCS